MRQEELGDETSAQQFLPFSATNNTHPAYPDYPDGVPIGDIVFFVNILTDTNTRGFSNIYILTCTNTQGFSNICILGNLNSFTNTYSFTNAYVSTHS